MEKTAIKGVVWQVGRTALLSSAFCLFAEAIFAVIVRAVCPAQAVVTIVNQCLQCVSVFVFSLLFLKRERLFFKGLAAGACTFLLTMLLFALIGGGFHLTVWALVEIPLACLAGGFGAILGGKLRKE